MKNNNQIQDIERYYPSVKEGLSNEQVNNRIVKKLLNVDAKKYSKTYLSIFLQNIFTFFNLLGLIVTLALIYIKAPLSSFFFVLIYCANIFIGIFQECRAKKTIDKLSLLSSKLSKVIRNGKICEISSKEIVLDDIIVLERGCQIPTDCEIKDGTVEVNESLLTGESVAIKKQIGDKLLAGSFIISGTCTVQAVCVGKENYIQKLSEKAKKYKKPRSEIMFSLQTIIKIVSCIIVPIATLYIVKAVLKNEEIAMAIEKTSTVVIGMIPSGMFLLTSMALAVGVIKLARHNTLVQDLYSLEMLARVDTVCFDKTGTITDGRMSVQEIVLLNDNENKDVPTIIASMLNSLRDSNQTASALYEKFGYSTEYTAKSVIPFNSERKFSAVTFTDNNTYAIGAPEFILSKIGYKNIEQKIQEYSRLGLRVILFAQSHQLIINDGIPKDFIPIALILINDSIRAEAFDTVKWFKQNDVEIKVISGDNPVTVSEVSKRVGINNAENFISLDGLTNEQVYEIANKYTVFGRVSPEQKAILVKSMKNAGHVTAMTGDGVNDILAMKEADCAITVASGSEATRNVSNLVLTDNNFNSMPKIVEEGRRVINNVQSSASLYLMKTLFTMFLSIIVLLIPSLVYYPFKLQQMILLEVLIIGLPSFFLSLQPNKDRVSGSFITYVISKSLPCALLMLIGVILAKATNFIIPSILPKTVTMLEVFGFTFAGIICLFEICRPFNRYRTALFAISASIVAIIFITAFLFGIELLQYSPITPLKDNVSIIISIVTIMIIEIIASKLLHKVFTKIKLLNINGKKINKDANA